MTGIEKTVETDKVDSGRNDFLSSYKKLQWIYNSYLMKDFTY
jgi:hypothetical protein